MPPGAYPQAQRLLTNSFFQWTFYRDKAHRGLCGSKGQTRTTEAQSQVPSSPSRAWKCLPLPHRPPQNPHPQGGLLSSLSHIPGTQDMSSHWHLLVQRPRDLIHLHGPREMFLGKGNSLISQPRGPCRPPAFTGDSPKQPAGLGQLCLRNPLPGGMSPLRSCRPTQVPGPKLKPHPKWAHTSVLKVEGLTAPSPRPNSTFVSLKP